LREVIEDSITAVSQLLKEDGIELEMHLPQQVPSILADRDRLQQVMLNLLSNAAKFCSRPGGKITVALAQQRNYLRVDVSDNGVGIGESEQEIIFEKFRQSGDTLTQKPKGSGLGLAISRQIIDHFGGRLWVRSRPGEGSTFSFTVPFRPGGQVWGPTTDWIAATAVGPRAP
jgi:signal transduction histidine kinase